MKITCISDTHGLHERIDLDLFPGGDLLIHAGDCTNNGSPRDLFSLNWWFRKLQKKYTNIILVPGNHDFCFERNFGLSKAAMTNCIVLFDEAITIDGLKFYGSPWQPRFFDWAFNVDRGAKIARKWAAIPDDTDVLITHGPPFGIGDVCFQPHTQQPQHVGCQDLTARIAELKNLKLHVCGHVHPGWGKVQIDGVWYINASTCTNKYKPTNLPIGVEL